MFVALAPWLQAKSCGTPAPLAVSFCKILYILHNKVSFLYNYHIYLDMISVVLTTPTPKTCHNCVTMRHLSIERQQQKSVNNECNKCIVSVNPSVLYLSE